MANKKENLSNQNQEINNFPPKWLFNTYIIAIVYCLLTFVLRILSLIFLSQVGVAYVFVDALLADERKQNSISNILCLMEIIVGVVFTSAIGLMIEVFNPYFKYLFGGLYLTLFFIRLPFSNTKNATFKIIRFILKVLVLLIAFNMLSSCANAGSGIAG